MSKKNECDELDFLTGAARNEIIKETLLEIKTKTRQPHSYQSILAQSRGYSVGIRLSSTARLFETHILTDDKLVPTGKMLYYSGRDIGDVFVKSALLSGKTYFPVSGDYSRIEGLRYLYLFSRTPQAKAYQPIAKFEIVAITSQEQLDLLQMRTLTDPTPFAYSTFKTIFEIANVETDNLPEDMLGNASGISIYERAFKGQNPAVFMI